MAPVGVEFPATAEGVQPDLVFVSNERRGIIADLTLKGPPDLVIEVLSTATAHRDRGLKLRLHSRRGVAQYWIVDPEADAVEIHRFGDIQPFERFTGRMPYALPERIRKSGCSASWTWRRCFGGIDTAMTAAAFQLKRRSYRDGTR